MLEACPDAYEVIGLVCKYNSIAVDDLHNACAVLDRCTTIALRNHTSESTKGYKKHIKDNIGNGAAKLHQNTALERQIPDIPVVQPPYDNPIDTIEAKAHEWESVWVNHNHRPVLKDKLFKDLSSCLGLSK